MAAKNSVPGPRNKITPLDSLRGTIRALKEIRASLLPFVRALKDDDGGGGRPPKADAEGSESGKKRRRTAEGATTSIASHRRAESEAAVALALGTLRFMGARLRGTDRGWRKNGPLRAELDGIRGLLVALRKLEQGGTKGKGAGETGGTSKGENRDDGKKGAGASDGGKRAGTDGAGEDAVPNKKQRRG